MTSNELRKGNFVNTPRIDQNPFRVDWFDEYKVYQNNGTYAMEFNGEVYDMPHHPLTWDLTDIQPIELTTEILEKAGLTHHKRTISFNDSGFDPINFWYIFDGLDEFNQRVYKYDFILGEFRDGFYYQARNRKKKGIKIESVHHFQNLIHALTHQELNINL